jgi:hypothetical protein
LPVLEHPLGSEGARPWPASSWLIAGLAFIDGNKGCYNALTVWENGCFVDELLEGGKHVA